MSAAEEGAVSRVLTDREIVMILAALRHWQGVKGLRLDPGWWEKYKPLTDEEIDELCERINHREFEEGK